MQFWKYQGAGNDFVMLDQRNQHWFGRGDTNQIAFLCNRHFGIGADGLILLQTHPDVDFEMVYFNADGRESTMCGNGGRCIVAFAKHLGIQKDIYRFLAIDGPHEARLTTPSGAEEEWVELKMQDVDEIFSEDSTGQENTEAADQILNTGSPHFVRFVHSIGGLDVKQQGRAIRYSDKFRQNGINVNFVEISKNGELLIRTYERGVEDETLACGTGVTAAALSFAQKKGLGAGKMEIPVKALGGDLVVRFMAHQDGHFSDIWLCGPAKRVFEGTISLSGANGPAID